jgi:hypothetical protein
MVKSGESSRDTSASTTHPEIRPFRIEVPEEDLVDLLLRIAETRRRERGTVAVPSCN